MRFQRWRPIKRHEYGTDVRGMRHDQKNGEYYLATDVDKEVRYLLGQLSELGWQYCREDDAA